MRNDNDNEKWEMRNEKWKMKNEKREMRIKLWINKKTKKIFFDKLSN